MEMRKHSRKIFASVVSALLVLMAAGFGSSAMAASTSGAQLSPVGEQALADVTTCLTSGKNPVLDVYYLIDNSGSLSYTDQNNVRQKVLESSVGQLQNFIDQGISVNFSESLFASSVSQVSPWRNLGTASDVSAAMSKVHQSVSNTHLRGYTDWEGGLRAAYQAFSQRPANTCKMLIWLTDGGINPTGQQEDILASIKALCHSGISSSSIGVNNSSYGLFSKLRDLNISIFGILYQNDASTLAEFESEYANGDSDFAGKERLELEHYLMSYMIPLVEGKGTIPDSAVASDQGLPPGGELQCAELDKNGMAPAGLPNGAFLNAKDPVGLSFQFMKLQNVIGGGTGSVIQNGHFNVPPGTASFRVITTAKNWKLTGPADSKVSIRSGTVVNSKNVSTVTTAGVTQIEVKSNDNSQFLGDWAFDAPGVTSEVFLFSGMTLSLDRDAKSKIIKDRPNTLTGEVIRTAEFRDLPVDLTRFDSHSLSLRTISSNGTFETVPDVKISLTNSGQFKIENYTPKTGSSGYANLWVTLDLGQKFQAVSSEFALSLVDAKAFPVPKSDSVVMSDLVGPKGISAGTLEVVGPTLSATSKFCLDSTPVRTSDSQTSSQKIDRMSSFNWKFDGHDSANGYCVEVARGETKSIKIEATNKHQANSHVVQIRGYVSSADSNQLGGQTLQFEFNSQAQSDPFAKWGSVILLLLLGIAGPLSGLYGFNKMTTKFLPTSGLVRADYPVQISQGPSTKLTDGRPTSKGSPILVQPNEFKPIVASPKGEKQISLGNAGTAKAIVKFWPPLTAPWFELVAPAGTRVISVFRGSTKNPAQFGSGKTQEISPNMGENWALVVPESELMKPATEILSGTLVIFSPMSPQLTQYQNKISGIASSPSIGRTLASIKESFSKETEKVTSSKKKGNGGNPPPAAPVGKPSGPKAPPGSGNTQTGTSSSATLSAPPSVGTSKPPMTPPPSAGAPGGLTPPPSTGGTSGGLKPPPGSNA
jgi:hypothetical protein